MLRKPKPTALLTWGILATALPAIAWSQDLPALSPLNPVSSSRSGLYFQPLRPAAPGRWITSVAMDYGSAIEYNRLAVANYVLDSELLRVTLGLSRDLSPRTFVLLEASAGGAYAGFMDGFLDWYHGKLGIRMSERESRPRDQFLYEITLPSGRSIQRDHTNFSLDDMRVGFGLRLAPRLQTVASLTLPTSTAPAGYGRGVPSINLLNTWGATVNPSVHYEGSLGVGYTSRTGALSQLQHESFVAITSGFRVHAWRRNSLFANLFYHSPYYLDTSLPALDRRELSLDFGWLVQTRTGSEWRVGMTEDLEPSGPGLDLVLRFGRTF